MSEKIRYLSRKEISTILWDHCIKNAVNQVVYAHSWYLDIAWENWSALVLGDYKYVMPLFPGKKWGIHFLCQPKFILQSGVFSPNLLNKEIVNRFLSAIPSNFKFVEINLNIYNQTGKLPGFEFIPSKSYQLDLIKGYDHLVADYSIKTLKCLKSAKEAAIFVNEELDATTFINFIKQARSEKFNRYSKMDYLIIQRIASKSMSLGTGKILSAFSSENELVATALFIVAGTKPVMLITSESEKGHEYHALYKIVNQFIVTYNGNNITLDFAASGNPGYSGFCEGFGALPVHNTSVRKKSFLFFHKLFLP